MFPTPGEHNFLFEIKMGFVLTHDDIHRPIFWSPKYTDMMTAELKTVNVMLNIKSWRKWPVWSHSEVRRHQELWILPGASASLTGHGQILSPWISVSSSEQGVTLTTVTSEVPLSSKVY